MASCVHLKKYPLLVFNIDLARAHWSLSHPEALGCDDAIG